jgi:hypothetical protein
VAHAREWRKCICTKGKFDVLKVIKKKKNDNNNNNNNRQWVIMNDGGILKQINTWNEESRWQNDRKEC